jgi:acetyltransferase EpsM
MKKILLYGGGGFAKEVCEIAELCGHQVIAYVGSRPDVLDRPYWGAAERLLERRSEFDAVVLAFGAVDRRTLALRAEALEWLDAHQLSSTPLVSPNAVVAKGVRIADGAIVAHGAVLSVDCMLEAHCIVNTCAIVGHDALIGRNVTLAPRAFVGGNAKVLENSLLGPGAIVLEHRVVGSNVVVGMGGTVARNVPDGATVMPLLSRVLKR